MIEALVAIAVVAISLAALGSLIANNLRATEWVDDRLALVDTARSVLTALPDRQQLSDGESRGEIADNAWRIDVLPFMADFVDPQLATPWIPKTVVIRVQSPTGEILRLDTVRLQRAP
jgi:general secretion pathway protein I